MSAEPAVRAVKDQPVSVYDMMQAEVEKAVTEPLTVTHPAAGMEAFTLTFNPDIDYKTQYEPWSKWARQAGGKKEIDPSLLNRRIIAETCIAISKDGEVLRGPSGEPVTFRDEDLIARYGARAIDAVKGFIVLDGGINAIADRIIRAAGYGAEVEEGATPKDL